MKIVWGRRNKKANSKLKEEGNKKEREVYWYYQLFIGKGEGSEGKFEFINRL